MFYVAVSPGLKCVHCAGWAQLQCGTDLAGRNYSNTAGMMKQQDKTFVARSISVPGEALIYSGRGMIVIIFFKILI